MTQEEYEERRRAFEEQLRADVALLNAAHEARIRSLDGLRQETIDRERTAGSPAVATAPVPPPPPPAPPPRPMRPRHSVMEDLENALPQLPAIFERKDIVRALGYEPPRTTLFRALERLQLDGAIAIATYSPGGLKVRYRKLDTSG